MNGTVESWRQQGFQARLDQWIDTDHPDRELVRVVIGWLLAHVDDPYQGARREPGFDNLWYATVPGSRRPPGTVVLCSYWVLENERLVRCDQISTLGWPA